MCGEQQCQACQKEYRHYIIKTVTGANDYASMDERSFIDDTNESSGRKT